MQEKFEDINSAPEVERGKVTKKDLRKVGLHSLYAQSGFNFERMQAGGYTAGMIPAFKKIYGDNNEEIGKAMTNNMDFINTEPHMLSFIQGLVISLEEAGEDRNLIKNLKNSLFGPLAGLGDAVFWFTLLPVSAAIATSFNEQGSILGPIIFILIWAVAALTRIWFVELGYNLGVSSISTLEENGPAISKAASTVGVMVVGGLIPTYVALQFPEDLMISGAVPVQSIFDTIHPNILPLAFVLFILWILRNKQISITNIILGIIGVSILLSVTGIM